MSVRLAEAQYRLERDTGAIAYLTRTGNTDLLPILGLVDEHASVGPGVCVSCGGPLRVDHKATTRYCKRTACQQAKATANAEGGAQ